tara:strand:- start:7474 stop:9606 length:2133 start_codon:yes stop_codon:yes gene_type:complete
MGKIVVAVVAFSMFAFILTDFFQSNSALFGSNDRNIAEIADTDITYEQFQAKVQDLSYVFAINNGREPLANEQKQIRDQAWNALILENAYYPQFSELGIQVSEDEQLDMVQGNNIHPQIRQFFTDPNTGEFSKANVQQFLSSLKNPQNPQAANQTASWVSFENSLIQDRLVSKYASLLTNSDFVTEAEAKAKFIAQSSNMTVDYFYVPFFSVSDSTFKVSDSEMESYLSSHSEQYQREESRSISYVSFAIEPSADDSLFVKEEIESLAAGLASADNDSIFAMRNSDSPNFYRSINDPGLIPVGLVGAEIGTVTEPILSAGKYTVMKLSDITEGDEAFVKARHILIESDGTSESAKAEAKAKANDILRQLRRGADFAELAAENSADQSNANNGGDLGWFGENGSFVQSFKDAVFAHKGSGLLAEPVETTFGYHIIRIDEPKTYTAYKVAVIEKELFESDATLNEIYRQADLLAANSDDTEAFVAKAQEAGLQVKNASNIAKNDTRVGVIADARAITLWLYNDAEVDKVSDVFELDNSYVVAVMTGRQMEGTAKLAQVKNEIETKVLNEKKAKFIKDKIAGLSGDDYDAMKEAYGTEARTGSADLTLNSNSFPNVGFAPEAVGVAFSLEEGEKTAPFETTNGVLVLTATSKSMAPDLESYDTYKVTVANERQSRPTIIANFPLSFSPLYVPQSLDNAVKEFADIQDKRYKFF